MENKSDSNNYKSLNVDLSQSIGKITISAESQKLEVRNAKENLLRPKIKIRLGTWNVCTMFETSKVTQVLSEMAIYQLDILGISECRWTGAGKQMASDGSVILYSGHTENHEYGVAIIVSREKAKILIEWESISARLIKVRFNSKHCKLTILQCYAPTKEADDEENDSWYEELKTAVSKVPQHNMLLIMGDRNAKVGANTNYERAMGKHGCGVINDNGRRFAEFSLDNSCVIGGTIFPQKNIHTLTLNLADCQTINQIDHIAINCKW